MKHLTPLRRPLVRRIGRLVVRITERGIELRGRGRRRSRLATWEQIAGLATTEVPILQAVEEATGRAVLERIGAVTEAKAEEEGA